MSDLTSKTVEELKNELFPDNKDSYWSGDEIFDEMNRLLEDAKAEIERMRPVVEAAVNLGPTLQSRKEMMTHMAGSEYRLLGELKVYENSKPPENKI